MPGSNKLIHARLGQAVPDRAHDAVWRDRAARRMPPAEIWRLRTQQGLDGAALVHGLLTLGCLIQRQLEVEDLAAASSQRAAATAPVGVTGSREKTSVTRSFPCWKALA